VPGETVPVAAGVPGSDQTIVSALSFGLSAQPESAARASAAMNGPAQRDAARALRENEGAETGMTASCDNGIDLAHEPETIDSGRHSV
jgi:hypothetical protein